MAQILAASLGTEVMFWLDRLDIFVDLPLMCEICMMSGQWNVKILVNPHAVYQVKLANECILIAFQILWAVILGSGITNGPASFRLAQALHRLHLEVPE